MTSESETRTLRPFEAPTYTQVSNYALDKIMPSLSGNEWKILCVVIRSTWGWEDAASPTGRRQEAALSLSRLRDRTGIGQDRTVIRALDVLIERGYISKRAGEPSRRGLIAPVNVYHLNTDYQVEITTPKNGAVTAVIDAAVEATTVTEAAVTTVIDAAVENSDHCLEDRDLKKDVLKERKEESVLFQKLTDNWPAILRDLEGSFTKATFRDDVKSIEPRSGDNGRVTLAVPNPAWVEARFLPILLRPLRALVNEDLQPSDLVVVPLNGDDAPGFEGVHEY